MRKIIHHIRTLLLTTTLESDNIKDMENTYTQADKDAVRILRAAYLESDASDTLYNARQYLQDRARYERLHVQEVAA